MGEYRGARGACARVQACAAGLAHHGVLCRLYRFVSAWRDHGGQTGQPRDAGNLDVPAGGTYVLFQLCADVLDGHCAASVDGVCRRGGIRRHHQDIDGLVRQGQRPGVRNMGHRDVGIGCPGERHRAPVCRRVWLAGRLSDSGYRDIGLLGYLLARCQELTGQASRTEDQRHPDSRVDEKPESRAGCARRCGSALWHSWFRRLGKRHADRSPWVVTGGRRFDPDVVWRGRILVEAAVRVAI